VGTVVDFKPNPITINDNDNETIKVDLEFVKKLINQEHVNDWANSFFDMIEWETELCIEGPECDKFIHEITKFVKNYMYST
jgi:hypothetical protein